MSKVFVPGDIARISQTAKAIDAEPVCQINACNNWPYFSSLERLNVVATIGDRRILLEDHNKNTIWVNMSVLESV